MPLTIPIYEHQFTNKRQFRLILLEKASIKLRLTDDLSYFELCIDARVAGFSDVHNKSDASIRFGLYLRNLRSSRHLPALCDLMHRGTEAVRVTLSIKKTASSRNQAAPKNLVELVVDERRSS